ncbi:hypothetical protein WAJ73_24330, partial [Acinetobacter baumannii]
TETISGGVFNESCYIALISEPTLLSAIDKAQDSKNRKKLLSQITMPSTVNAQDMLKSSDSLYVHHESFVSQFLNSLSTE